MFPFPSARELASAIRESNQSLQVEFETIVFEAVAEELNAVMKRTKSEPRSRIGSYTVLRFDTRFSWCDTQNIMDKMHEAGYKVVFTHFGPNRPPGIKPSIEIHWNF